MSFNRSDYPELRATLIDTGQPLSLELLDRLKDTLEAHNPSGPIVPSDELIERLLKIPADEAKRVAGIEPARNSRIVGLDKSVWWITDDTLGHNEIYALDLSKFKPYSILEADGKPLRTTPTFDAYQYMSESMKRYSEKPAKPKRLTKKRKAELMRQTKEQLVKEIEKLTGERDNSRRQFQEMGELANDRLMFLGESKEKIELLTRSNTRLQDSCRVEISERDKARAEVAALTSKIGIMEDTIETQKRHIESAESLVERNRTKVIELEAVLREAHLMARIYASKGKRS